METARSPSAFVAELRLHFSCIKEQESPEFKDSKPPSTLLAGTPTLERDAGRLRDLWEKIRVHLEQLKVIYGLAGRRAESLEGLACRTKTGGECRVVWELGYHVGKELHRERHSGCTRHQRSPGKHRKGRRSGKPTHEIWNGIVTAFQTSLLSLGNHT